MGLRTASLTTIPHLHVFLRPETTGWADFSSSRSKLCLFAALVVLAGCGAGDDRPLTSELAEQIVLGGQHPSEPVYAEVPEVVSWSPELPKDEFDERSISTLEKLEGAGFVTLSRSGDDSTGKIEATLTREGFEVMGFVGSARGRALRGRIATKILDRVQAFERHPVHQDVGRVELVWHYESPTPLYDLFDTRIDKELGRPFVSIVSIHREKGSWRTDLIVRKQRSGA